MEPVIIGVASFVVGVLVTASILFMVRRGISFSTEARIKLLEERNVALQYESQSLHEELGGREALLGTKEKQVSELERNAEHLGDLLQRESEKNRSILSQKKSSEIRTGHIAETLAPFFLLLEGHDIKKLRHMGQPIDFIAFDPDGVTFIEIKSGKSTLSYNQRQIKQLIKDKKVFWKELRINKSAKTKSRKKR